MVVGAHAAAVVGPRVTRSATAGAGVAAASRVHRTHRAGGAVAAGLADSRSRPTGVRRAAGVGDGVGVGPGDGGVGVGARLGAARRDRRPHGAGDAVRSGVDAVAVGIAGIGRGPIVIVGPDGLLVVGRRDTRSAGAAIGAARRIDHRDDAGGGIAAN